MYSEWGYSDCLQPVPAAVPEAVHLHLIQQLDRPFLRSVQPGGQVHLKGRSKNKLSACRRLSNTYQHTTDPNKPRELFIFTCSQSHLPQGHLLPHCSAVARTDFKTHQSPLSRSLIAEILLRLPLQAFAASLEAILVCLPMHLPRHNDSEGLAVWQEHLRMEAFAQDLV